MKLTGHAIVETKTSPFGEGWGDDPEDIPVYVKCQAQWYLDVFGWDLAYIPVLVSGCDYREYIYRHNQADAEFLREAGAAFVWSVEHDERPSIDVSEQTYEAVRELHPLIDGTRVDVSDAQGEAFIRAKIAEVDSAAEFRRQRSLLAEAMGNAKLAMWGDVKLADRRAKSTESLPYLQANGEKALRAGLAKHATIREAVLAKRAAQAAAVPTLTIPALPAGTEGATQ